jgi:hypothetical protein
LSDAHFRKATLSLLPLETPFMLLKVHLVFLYKTILFHDAVVYRLGEFAKIEKKPKNENCSEVLDQSLNANRSL